MPEFIAKSNHLDAKRPAIASPELVKLIAEQRATALPHVRMYIDGLGRAVMPGAPQPVSRAAASPELVDLLQSQDDARLDEAGEGQP